MKARQINAIVVRVQKFLVQNYGETMNVINAIRQMTAELNSADVRKFNEIEAKYMNGAY